MPAIRLVPTAAVVLLLGAFPTGEVLSATYFVDDNAYGDPGPNDPSESNPLEDGSADYPFDSIQEALDRAYPYDTVQVLPGTYVEALVVKHEGVTLRGQGPASTVVRGPAGTALLADRVSSFPGLEMRATVEGFKFIGWVFMTQVDAASLRNVEIVSGNLQMTTNSTPVVHGERVDIVVDSVKMTGGSLGLYFCHDTVNSFTIRRLTAPTTGLTFGGCTDAGAGMQLLDSTVASLDAGPAVFAYGISVARTRFTGAGIHAGHQDQRGTLTVTDSTFDRGGLSLVLAGNPMGNGLDDDTSVRGCSFTDTGIEYRAEFSVNDGDALALGVESSRFLRSGVTTRFSGLREVGGSSRIRIANNVFDSSPIAVSSSWDMRDAGLGSRPQNLGLDLVNNTIHQAATAVQLAVNDHVTGLDSLTVLVQNNILSGGEVGAVAAGRDDLSLSLVANDVFGQSVDRYRGDVPDPTGSSGNISADPLFVDAAAGDFSLEPSSPCVDAGAAGPAVPATDRAGTTRPQDGDGDGIALPDIGAFELIFVDGDGDGFPPGVDCDDTDPAAHPLAPDLPGDSVDEDCDGVAACDPAEGWRNHGLFVRCVRHACVDLTRSGLVSQEQCQSIGLAAARSNVGKPDRRGAAPRPLEP